MVRSFRGPVRGGHRSGRVRSVGIAVAALLVLTAGIAVGGLLEPTPPPGPQDDDMTRTEPTKAAPCHQPATDEIPPFALVAAGAQRPLVAGLRGFVDQAGTATNGSGWLIPDGRTGRSVLNVSSGTPIDLVATGSACVHHLAVEYAEASILDPTFWERQRRNVDPDPSAARVSLGSLPDGDWVVRVIAFFETGRTGLEGRLDVERFFRVRSGPGPFADSRPSIGPAPTPRVTPAVPCAGAPTGGEAIQVALRNSIGDPVVGVPDGSEPVDVVVALGEDVELSVVGDACAIAWRIQTVPVESEDGLSVEDLTNPGVDPGYASQNRWRLDLPAGDFRLVAELTFEAGTQVTRTWNVVGRGFDVPDVFLVGTDGTRVVALPGCGLYVELANGYQAGDECGVIEFPDGLEVLSVPAWSRVSIEVPGWALQSWSGHCGTVATDNAGTNVFDSGGCGLGGFSVEPGEMPPGPARFLARPGPQALQIYVQATRDGNMFSVPMYAYVTGR